MKLIRRVAATLAMAGIAAIGVRLGGKGGTPRQHGGWTPVDLDQLGPRTDRPSGRPSDSADQPLTNGLVAGVSTADSAELEVVEVAEVVSVSAVTTG